ncbi:MAG: choice-of-anchor D domain-containing protein [Myxococcales bacterium]
MPLSARSSSSALCLLSLLLLASCNDGYGTQRTHSTIAVEPLSLDFGQLEAGESKALTLSVTNTGSTTLHVTRGYVRNDKRSAFSAQELATQIAAGAEMMVELTYLAPDAEGADGAEYVIESDADNAPEYVVSLTGRATERCLLGQRWCDGKCVDTAADPAHCGDCTTTCTAPQKCLQGRCGCEAKTCATNACGDADDGCGQTLHCGDCVSPQVCIDLRCLAATCTDHLKDGDETDVDCGGKCSPCAMGKGCATLADCEAGLACIEKVCSPCRTIADCPVDQVCRDGICGACLSRDECGAERACLGGRCLSCPGEAAYNECGLCGGAPVPWVGAKCSGLSGCEAKYVCNTQLVGVDCPNIAMDACGACGGTTTAAEIGADCTDPVSGCLSKWACVGTVKTCVPVARDACGACGGTAAAADLGKPCFDTDTGCSSTWACVGTVKTCTPVAKDACGACGGTVTAADIGRSCTDPASGCVSKRACVGTALTCTPVPKDACGACGGTVTAADLAAPCNDPASGCVSGWACVATVKTCTPVAKDACGACGGSTTLADIGAPCNDPASGCLSKWACVGTAKTCTPVAKDVCGACGGTTSLADLNVPCTDPASGCLSKTACVGTAKTCAPVGRDACGACGGTATAADIGAPCNDPASGCLSKRACVGTALTCTAVAMNGCDLCGGPAIANPRGTPCASAGCAGTWQCTGDNTATVCNAPTSCSTANHLVISQICGQGPGYEDDFVELYNPTSSPIDVTQYRLFYRNYANVANWTNYVDLSPTGTTLVIQPHKYFLVGQSTSATYASLADVSNTNFNVGADKGQLVLWKAKTALGSMPALPAPSNSNYVDFVGWGTASYWEGATIAVAPGTAGVIVRKARPSSDATTMISTGTDGMAGNGTDTDNNGADFVRLTEFAPRNSATPARP